MSTTDDSVTIEPVPGELRQGRIVGRLPRTNCPEDMLRIDVEGTIWRVPEEECE